MVNPVCVGCENRDVCGADKKAEMDELFNTLFAGAGPLAPELSEVLNALAEQLDMMDGVGDGIMVPRVEQPVRVTKPNLSVMNPVTGESISTYVDLNQPGILKMEGSFKVAIPYQEGEDLLAALNEFLGSAGPGVRLDPEKLDAYSVPL